jgi:uncharacterized lipoprotein YddW (UPF0748 family)
MRIASHRGMRIHAWFNLFVAGSWSPGKWGARHVLSRNPDWQVMLKDGRLLEGLSREERKRLHLEGVFLDPGHPGVIPYLRGLVRELTWRYAIDGIHFDYVRYPWADAGYGEPSRLAFLAAKEAGEIVGASSDDEADLWDAWRAGKVSEAVSVLASIARLSAPGIEVTAAVVPDPVDALDRCKQDWVTWIRRGWCDRVLLMAYTSSTDRLDSVHRKVSAFDPQGTHTVFGLGLHNLKPRSLGKLLDHLGAKGIVDLALFSDIQFAESQPMRNTVRRFWHSVEGR